MKPDYKTMSKAELKRYVLDHREDMEAIRELFINRSDPNGKVYPFAMEEEEQQEGFEALRRRVECLEHEGV